MAMLPASLDSKHLANGSVVKIRKPLEVPRSSQAGDLNVPGMSLTNSQMAVILVEGNEVHRHLGRTRRLAVKMLPLPVHWFESGFCRWKNVGSAE
jgi:hypothetical protein